MSNARRDWLKDIPRSLAIPHLLICAELDWLALAYRAARAADVQLFARRFLRMVRLSPEASESLEIVRAEFAAVTHGAARWDDLYAPSQHSLACLLVSRSISLTISLSFVANHTIDDLTHEAIIEHFPEMSQSLLNLKIPTTLRAWRWRAEMEQELSRARQSRYVSPLNYPRDDDPVDQEYARHVASTPSGAVTKLTPQQMAMIWMQLEDDGLKVMEIIARFNELYPRQAVSTKKKGYSRVRRAIDRRRKKLAKQAVR